MGIFMKKGNWWIDYRACGRRRREKIGPSKTLAIRVLHKRKAEIEGNRYLEKEEIFKLLFYCSERIRPVVAIAVFTGMRRREIVSLKWQDIDFRRGIIYISETKNGAKREVSMNDFVKDLLIKIPRHPGSPYVFCDKNRKPYHDIRKSFFTALKKSGILNFRFHDLRHTFASQLVMAGIDINTVRKLLGHKDIRMTLRYSHLSQDHKRRAVGILSSHRETIWTPDLFLNPKQKWSMLQPIEN